VSTFTQLKASARRNIDDIGVKHYTAGDIDTAAQEGYEDIAALTQCIIQRFQIPWIPNLSYYDFRSLGVTDLLMPIAIYNELTKTWLRDDRSLRHFDMMRQDWELAKGTPEYWCPVNFKYTAIFPKYNSNDAINTFFLYYATTAPTIVDAETPLIATDFQNLIIHYITGTMLEDDEEFVKAEPFWQLYYAGIEKYTERVKNISRADLLMVI
jgi:hypothetical protein